MSFSAHRPGRFGSDGQIEFDSALEKDADEALYLSDVLAQRDAQPTEPLDRFADAAAPTARVAVPTATAERVTEPLPDPFVVPAARPERRPTPTPESAPKPEPEPETRTFEQLFGTEQQPDPEPTVAPVAPVTRRAERPRQERRPMRRLAILGGADGAVLDTVPSETARYVQMFFVLAGTALVSGISMYFALITGVQIAILAAIPLAIIWMLIIFNLDRFLTSSMKSTRNGWKLFGLAFPRVLMAAVIGIVVAEPLVLQIFHNDIQREVTTTNLTQANGDQDQLNTGPERKALDEARATVTALESQAATGVVAGTSTTSGGETAAQAAITTLQKQLDDQQKVIDKARAIYQCELTGEGVGTVEGCTGVQGQGASSDAAKSQLDAAQQTYDGLAQKMKDATGSLASAQSAGAAATSASEESNRKQANDELPGAKKTYQAALAAYNARAEQVSEGNAAASGLLSQITALNRLSDKEPTLSWAHWLIAALFFLIELLPVLVKVLTSHGDPSIYEKAEKIHREVALDRATANGWRERAKIATERGTPAPV